MSRNSAGLRNPKQELGHAFKNQGNFTMSTEEMIMEVRETQAFWKGVVRGVIGSAVFFAGLVAVIYYIVSMLTVVGK
nr:MAG TPA: hypothetical protein [Caudoviricetes sp.]